MKATKKSVSSIYPPSPGQDLLDALAARSLLKNELEYDGKNIIRDNDGDIDIKFIEETATSLRNTDDKIFALEKGLGGKCYLDATPLGKKVKHVLEMPFDILRKQHPGYTFSPHYLLIEKMAKRVPTAVRYQINRYVFAPTSQKEFVLILRFIAMVRRRLRSATMRGKQRAFRRTAEENFRGLINRVAWVAERHKYAVVLRWDTHAISKDNRDIQKTGLLDIPVYADDPHGIHQYAKHCATFRTAMLAKFGKHVLGWSAGLENGFNTKLHTHYFVMLDASWKTDDIETVEWLREKWAAITGDIGGFHNCNAVKNGYFNKALGRVCLDDRKVIIGLQWIVAYITLEGVYKKLDIHRPALSGFSAEQRKYQAYTAGKWPKAPVKAGPGRPAKRAPGAELLITLADALKTRLARF